MDRRWTADQRIGPEGTAWLAHGRRSWTVQFLPILPPHTFSHSLPLTLLPLITYTRGVDDVELLRLAEKEFAAAEEQAKKAMRERDAAQQRLDLANRALQAWAAIVEQKRQATGLPPPSVAPSTLPGFTNDEDGPRSRTDWVRGWIRAAGDKGATPAQIRSLTEHLGLPVNENFPHSILSKLKARGEIVKAKGRYVTKKP